MAAQQRRLITAANSKLGKVDLVSVLRKDEAWSTLPLETRSRLCSLLPESKDGGAPHNPDVNPLTQSMRYHIEAELRRWQEDLKEGKETKKWREEATQAGHDRVMGKFDEWRDLQREEYWGSDTVAGSEAAAVDKAVNGSEAKAPRDEETTKDDKKVEA